MKKTYLLYLLLSFTLLSCFGNIPKGKEKKDLFGKWEGRTFINPYFDLKINLSENWKRTDKDFKTIFGAKFIEADYYIEEDSIDALVRLTLKCDKINPFDKKSTVSKELKESVDAMKTFYDENEMIAEELKPIHFGKRKYILSRIVLLDEGDSTFIDEYMSYEKDYFLSLTLSYRTVMDRDICDEILQQLK